MYNILKQFISIYVETMKNNVHFVGGNWEDIHVTSKKTSSWIPWRNVITAALLTSILITGCWGKSKDSAQTAKLKAQTELSKDLDKAKEKVADAKEELAEAQKELENAEKAYEESLDQ